MLPGDDTLVPTGSVYSLSETPRETDRTMHPSSHFEKNALADESTKLNSSILPAGWTLETIAEILSAIAFSTGCPTIFEISSVLAGSAANAASAHSAKKKNTKNKFFLIFGPSFGPFVNPKLSYIISQYEKKVNSLRANTSAMRLFCFQSLPPSPCLTGADYSRAKSASAATISGKNAGAPSLVFRPIFTTHPKSFNADLVDICSYCRDGSP